MLLKNLSELRSVNEQAVIINTGTRLVTTLALLSTLRHAHMPVLVIDCDTGDDSLNHFKQLMRSYTFDLLSAPLKPHGDMLNWLFAQIPAQKVLLIDSDIEILNAEIFEFIQSHIDDERTFGAGFVNEPGWLEDHTGLLKNAYYQERLWMPLTMLKVKPAREALHAGVSFRERVVFNDFYFSQLLGRGLMWVRLRVGRLRHWQPRLLNRFKRSYNGNQPSVVYCDTGADIYQYLKYSCAYLFAGLPEKIHGQYVKHLAGVSRRRLDKAHGGGTLLEMVEGQVEARLREMYDYEMPGAA